MTSEKLSASNNPVLRTIGNLFTTDMLSGKCLPVSAFPFPPDTQKRSFEVSVGKGVASPAAVVRAPTHHTAFDRRMSDVGWIRSQAWSAWFIETVYTHTLTPWHKSYKAFTDCCSGSCLEMYRKLDISFLFTFNQTPTPGAIAFWQYGTTWMGHAGIVLSVSGTRHFTCIEGHNPTGAEDGFCIKIKTRKLPVRRSSASTSPALNPSGLNLIGFITPLMRQPIIIHQS
jgi:hypothetical protein